jgi:hypothetical protein
MTFIQLIIFISWIICGAIDITYIIKAKSFSGTIILSAIITVVYIIFN